jgi:hypothetical protein
METYYVYSNDSDVLTFVLTMARQRNANVFEGFPPGFTPGDRDCLLVYDKYLNRHRQFNGRIKIIEYVREQQFKIPLW